MSWLRISPPARGLDGKPQVGQHIVNCF
jgi:hypothetical protein